VVTGGKPARSDSTITACFIGSGLYDAFIAACKAARPKWSARRSKSDAKHVEVGRRFAFSISGRATGRSERHCARVGL
jgi:hypothetical protein